MRRPVTDGLFEIDSDEITLIGGYSPTSGLWHFPASTTCPYSGAPDVEQRPLSRTGRLWGWTSVTVAPPGYRGSVPYGFGVVELDETPLRVVGRITESDVTALRFGAPMCVVAETVFNDGDSDIVTWAFASLDAERSDSNHE